MVNGPLIAVRAIHFAATLILAGAVIFGALISGPVLGRTDDAASTVLRLRLLRIAWVGFGVAVISGIAWLVLLAAQVSDRAPAQGFSAGILETVLLDTTFGHDWLVRLALATLLAAALAWISPRHTGVLRRVVAALPATAFAAALVYSGHAAATEGWSGTFHRAADGLHLIAASAWLGGLVPLALLLEAARRQEISLGCALAATSRFSTLGVISVGTLIATGIVNGWVLAGGVPAWIGTDYGRLLLIKVVLFFAMVAMAAVNRLRLTPRLAGEAAAASVPAKALRALIRNSLIEVALGLAILVIVGALGTTPPGAHVQPTWPFAIRFSDAAFDDPTLRGEIVLALWAIAGGVMLGVLLIVVGLVIRRRRWPLIVAGGAVAVASLVYVAPTLSLLTVEAYPTSFHVSPTGYSASSVVQGAELFATHCASCHGPQGRGDGPAGRFLRVKPSDLTADHVYSHSDGDLYWWISYGISEVMPPFGATLNDEARWNLIDFVRANADAVHLAQAPTKVTDVGYQAPDFSAACPDGPTVRRDDLRGRIAHLILAGRASVERVAQLAARSFDTVAVMIPLEDVTSTAACRTDDAELAKALALFRGKDVTQIDGTEFLLDPSGALRAMWYPGARPDWRETDVLRGEIAAVRSNPTARRTPGSHHHVH
jgi:putative copper export protein/mono/diheme cytochrome c family protein